MTQIKRHSSTSLKIDGFVLDFDFFDRVSPFVIVGPRQQSQLVDATAQHLTLAATGRAVPHRSFARAAWHVVKVPTEAQIPVSTLVFNDMQRNGVPQLGSRFLVIQQHGCVNCGETILIILVLHHVFINSLKLPS